MGILRFFRQSFSNSMVLFRELYLPPEGGGGDVFGDGFADPTPHPFEALLGQFKACQLLLHYRFVNEVHLGKNRRKVDLLEQPDGLGGESISLHGGGGYRKFRGLPPTPIPCPERSDVRLDDFIKKSHISVKFPEIFSGFHQEMRR